MQPFPYMPNWYPFLFIIVPILVVWSAVWKGFALWKAARNHQLAWYIVMLILNTAGILEIIYIFGFSKPKEFHNKIDS